MLSKVSLPDSQIILSERFSEVDKSFIDIRYIRCFVRNFIKSAPYVGLKYVSVFLVPSLTPKRWDMVFIYSSKWLNSRSLNRLKVLPKTLYFSSRIELL
nr:MAG TPA: hypothetical protein [Microviridae sp.]